MKTYEYLWKAHKACLGPKQAVIFQAETQWSPMETLRKRQSPSSGPIDNRDTINRAVIEMQANRLEEQDAMATGWTESLT